jgi:hypothetical protein
MCFASRLQPFLVHQTFTAGKSSQGLALRVKEFDLQCNTAAAEDISDEHAQNSPCTIDEDLHQKFAGLANEQMVSIPANISTHSKESTTVSGLIGTNHADPSALRSIEQEHPFLQIPTDSARETCLPALMNAPKIQQPKILEPVRRCILPPGQAILPPPRRFYGRRWHSFALAAATGDRAARMALLRAERVRLEGAPPARIRASSAAAASG